MQESIDPYVPPKSNVATPAKSTHEAYFFTTSTLKLAVMSISTFGLYELYWFYKNWVLIKERTGQNIMPFGRAIFAPFWAYSCFKHIKIAADENAVPESLSIGVLATAYFLLYAILLLPDPYWLVSTFTFVLLIPANGVALRVNKQVAPNFENNDNFSGWNWLAFVIGGMLLVLSIVSILMPEVPAS
jgi:hypothetical protein